MPASTACRERPPMTPSPTAAGHAPSTTPGARILAMGEYVENPVAEAFGNVTGLALPATCGTTMPSATTCQRPGVLPVTRCVKATRPEPGRTRGSDAATWKSSPGPRRPVTSRRLPVKRTATWYGYPDSAASNQYVKPMACGVRPASVADPMVTNSSEPVGPGPRPIRADRLAGVRDRRGRDARRPYTAGHRLDVLVRRRGVGEAVPGGCPLHRQAPGPARSARPGRRLPGRRVVATGPARLRAGRLDASGDRQDAGALACGGRRHGRAASGGQSQAGHVAEGFGNRVLDVLTHREDARTRCGAGCVARGCGARRHRRSLPAGGARRHSWAPGRTGLPARPCGECARRGRREGVLPPYSPEGEGRAPGGRNERPGLRAYGSGRLRCRWIGGGGADRAPVGRHGAGAPPRAGHRTTRVLLRGLLRRHRGVQ